MKVYMELDDIPWNSNWDPLIESFQDAQIPILIQSLDSTPINYDNHLKLIHLLEIERQKYKSIEINSNNKNEQSHQDLQNKNEFQLISNLLKRQFHVFHKNFPFNEFLWKNYITLCYEDTINFIESDFDMSHKKINHEQRKILIERLLSLFNCLDIAVLEYFMFDIEILRLKVAQSINILLQSNINDIQNQIHLLSLKNFNSLKNLWEDCLERCSGDYWNGSLLWKLFFQSQTFTTEFSIEEKRNYFQKSVLIPLKGVEELWDLYWDWEQEPHKELARTKLKVEHLSTMQLVKKLENQCAKNIEKYLTQNQESNPKLVKHFERFISILEESNDYNLSIFSMYRRSITICCLSDLLWENFIDYLWSTNSKYLNVISINSTRNCTWNATLWTSQMAFFSKSEINNEKRRAIVRDIFLKAQTFGLSNSSSYFKLFTWFCSHLKDEFNYCSNDIERNKIGLLLKETFQNCSYYFETYFPDSKELKDFLILWAQYEIRFFHNNSNIKIIMNSLIQRFPNNIELLKIHFNLEMEVSNKLNLQEILEKMYLLVDGRKSLDELNECVQSFCNLQCSLIEREEWELRLKNKSQELKKILRQKDKEKKLNQKIEENNPKKRKNENLEIEKSNKRKKLNEISDHDIESTQNKKIENHTFLNKRNKESQNKNSTEPVIRPITTLEASQTLIGPSMPSKLIGPTVPTQVIGPSKPSQVIGPSIPIASINSSNNSSLKEEFKQKNQFSKNYNDSHTVFMFKIPFSMNQQDVSDYFTKHGCNVKSARLLRTQEHKSKGQAFIEMLDKESVTKALSLDKDIVRKMEVRISLPRQNKFNNDSFKNKFNKILNASEKKVEST